MKLILFYFSMLTFVESSAQKIDTLMNGSVRYNNAWQLSGIAVYKNKFYMPAEKCGELVVAKMDGSIDTIIDLPFFDTLKIKPGDVEMEAIAVYKHWLLITDESKQYHRLYSYDLDKGSLAILNTGDELINDTGFFGMEGIAVNEKDSICYVLKERNENFQSVIRQFKIFDNGTNIELRFISNTVVQHEQKNIATKNVRYADLVYDSKRLLLLKSYYVKSDTFHHANYYGIDSICLNEKGLMQRNFIQNAKDELYLHDLTRSVKAFAEIKLPGDQKYSTNLEGICVYKGNIFLVSDNSQSKDSCSKVSNERTLLLQMPPAF